jgi:sterol desaturase/sphingolipid hydroxylase (fatty acid hydroxylase superfamily)
MTYAIKILIASLIAVAASEIAKRSSALGALVVALPLTSMMAMSFLYYDTRSAEKVAGFARAIPLMVLPTLLFFYAFAFLVDKQAGFVMAMVLATAIMLACYALYMFFFARNGL